MKFIVEKSGIETNFSELRDPLTFLNYIKINQILVQKTQYKQECHKHLKQIRTGNKSEEQKNDGWYQYTF